jgi:hypothetical protein
MPRRSTHAIVRILALTVACSGVGAGPAWADIAKFELDGRIYTKHLYQNDGSQGLLSLGNPFWPDNISGHNGVGSEFELGIKGHVSQQVEAGVRLASRFGERWQDWWESGNSFYNGVENTSGDSAGMNRASYMKLRGSYVQVAPQIAGIDWIRVGSSDFSMFNPWTIGKVRYIDRDNGRGYFASGHFGRDDAFQWHVGAIAMPKLWVGPSWSTGLGDPNLTQAFWSRDWAYAGSLRWQAGEHTVVRLVGDFTQDLEIDKADPDALGSSNPNCLDKLGQPIPGCAPDHAVDLLTRYASFNGTFDIDQELSETVRVTGLLGYFQQRIDPTLATNGVALNQGVFPIVYKDAQDFAGTVRLTANDPFDNGLSLQAEYFNIGADWNSIFGARRESDVLLTDGFIGSGGQLPTMNLANEFVDFDDEWVESCIGWHGGTGLLTWDHGDTRIQTEYTYLTFNTNTASLFAKDKQDHPRDVDKVYPDFLHSDGFTDTALYDYANTTDRGRDPRSVYHRNQARRSSIAVLKLHHQFPVGRGLELDIKGKYINDFDARSLLDETDDYQGNIYIARAKLALPVADGVKVGLIGQYDHWDEQNRKGTLQLGYGDDLTDKTTLALQTTVLFEGIKVSYYLEHIDKDQHREREGDQHWNVWRSKATIEAAW